MIRSEPARYLILLLVQTLCALTILFHVQAVFRALIESMGVRMSMPAGNLALMVAAVAIGQATYWYRLKTTPLPGGYRNLLLGHVFAFASRISFVFGGALFSLYFLRHLPAMQLSPFSLDFAWRAVLLLAILFALYCYTLELERLGNALQSPRRQPGREDDRNRKP